MDKVFITNQEKLAGLADITPQYLSSIKTGKNEPGDTLITILESLTGIDRLIWKDPNRKLSLKGKLKEFFTQQRAAEADFIRSFKMSSR